MSRPVFYVAHPVSPNSSFRYNARKAERWLGWLMQHDRSRVYIAPWISEVRLFIDNRVTTTYEEALSDDLEVVTRCDGIILVGGKISNGMQRELDCARDLGKSVIDLSMFNAPWSKYASVDNRKIESLVISFLGTPHGQAN